MSSLRVLSAIRIASAVFAVAQPTLATASDVLEAGDQADEASSGGLPTGEMGGASEGVAGLEGTAASRAAYDKGVALAGEKRFIEAQREFEQAVSERPPLEAYFGLGQVELALGHPCAAVQAYSKYLEVGGFRIPRSKQLAVRTHLEQLRRAGASEEECQPSETQSFLYLQCEVKDVSALVDGKPQSFDPQTPITLAPGPHDIQFRSPGTSWPVSQIQAETAKAVYLTCVHPNPAAVTPAVDSSLAAENQDSGSGLSTQKKVGVGIAAGGVGVALAALGHFLWNRGRYEGYRIQRTELEEHGGTSAEWDAFDNLGSSIDRAAKVSLGLAIAGGALTTVGVTLILLDSGTKSKDESSADSGHRLLASFSGRSGQVAWRASW